MSSQSFLEPENLQSQESAKSKRQHNPRVEVNHKSGHIYYGFSLYWSTHVKSKFSNMQLPTSPKGSVQLRVLHLHWKIAVGGEIDGKFHWGVVGFCWMAGKRKHWWNIVLVREGITSTKGRHLIRLWFNWEITSWWWHCKTPWMGKLDWIKGDLSTRVC